MEAKVNWHNKLHFTGSAETGFEVPLDASSQVGGEDDGFRPLELMALSLAGCTAMDVISILQKKRQNVTGFEVRVQAERATEHPRVFTHAVIHYLVTGNDVDEKAVLRSIELSANRYCPAQAMLGGVFPMELRYSIYAEGGELVSSGTYEEGEV